MSESGYHAAAKRIFGEWLRASAAQHDISTPGEARFGPIRWKPGQHRARHGVVEEFVFSDPAICWSTLRVACFGVQPRARPLVYPSGSPTYAEARSRGLTVVSVADIALVEADGSVATVVEINHTHPVSNRKINTLKRLGVKHLFELDSDFVLRQCGPQPNIPPRFYRSLQD